MRFLPAAGFVMLLFRSFFICRTHSYGVSCHLLHALDKRWKSCFNNFDKANNTFLWGGRLCPPYLRLAYWRAGTPAPLVVTVRSKMSERPSMRSAMIRK